MPRTVLFLLGLAALWPAAAQQACTLQLGGDTLTFQGCTPTSAGGADFTLLWNVSADGQGVTWGMSASSGGGYQSFAYPSTPEKMVGATAFSLQACSSCASGAQLRQYFLAGTGSGDMEPVSTFPIDSLTLSTAGGGLAAVFTTTLPAGANTQALPLLFAAGAVYSNGFIRQHQTYGWATLDMGSGALSGTQADSKAISALVATHLWLLLIGWGVLIPCGIVMARLKPRDPLWFKVHRAVQTLGLVLGLVGFGLGFAIAGNWNTLFATHRNLGVAAIALGIVQLPALRWRPALDSPRRRLWNVGHWWVGRAATVLGVANVFYGLITVLAVSTGAWAAYTAVLSLIVAGCIAKESYDYSKLPPPGLKQVSKGELQLADGSSTERLGNGALPSEDLA